MTAESASEITIESLPLQQILQLQNDATECDKLIIPTTDGTAITSTSTSSEQPAVIHQAPPVILCDAWFGFPTQVRPRSERVRAVSRQLSNFIQWRSEFFKNSMSFAKPCHVCLLGKDDDLKQVSDRLVEINNLLSTASQCQTVFFHEIVFEPNIGILQYVQQSRQENESSFVENDIVYLSPDAPSALPSTSAPPRIVVVGMLIDRRISAHRSRIRAESSLNLCARKLPLDELNVKGLTSGEPLNIDVVLELMQRWWYNCDVLENDLYRHKSDTTIEEPTARCDCYKKCFLDAASWAMKSQRDRHPTRTIHKV